MLVLMSLAALAASPRVDVYAVGSAPLNGSHMVEVRAMAGETEVWYRPATPEAFQDGHAVVELELADARWATVTSLELRVDQQVQVVPVTSAPEAVHAEVALTFVKEEVSGACTQMGAARWSSSSGTLFVCDGTTWQTVAALP